MFAASKTAKAASAAAPTDPQFNYVTMLLHGDGTNGAQNNTFLDSSTNNFTITRNGNTTQGTWTPYGANWSNYFDGSGDTLNTASNAAFGFGSGAWTFEAWVYPTTSQTDNWIIATNDAGKLRMRVGASGYLSFFTDTGSVSLNSTTVVTVNAWSHVAICYDGTTLSLFQNGTRTATSTVSISNGSANACYIGSNTIGGGYWNGYISNARVVKGSAVYSGSTYTVPTAPLTAISGTSLLTCADNRFIDDSTNNFTITVSGNVSVQRFSPFSPTTAYSTSVIGGSGYFDGTGDYLSVSANTAFVFGTGDFTVEAWIYPTSYPTDAFVISNLSNGDTSWAIEIYAGNIRFTGWATVWLTATQPSTGAWHHVAVSRSGTTLSMYVDGTRVATTTNSTNLSANNTLVVGDYIPAGGANFIGYISNARLVKGTAVYTGTSLTVPTTPLTAISGTSFLANFINAGILDNAMMSDLETVGNAQISTSVKKYGTGSIALDGTGDWLLFPANDRYAFGTGDYTVEAWVYFTSINSSNLQIIFASGNSGGNTFYAHVDADQISVGTPTVFISNQASSFTTNTWYHIAFCRASGTLRLFKDGVQQGSSVTDSTNWISGGSGRIGANDAGNQTVSGYIDDLRISKGYARYTSNFTPPTAAFPNN